MSLVTVENLNVPFNENIEEMERQLAEYTRLQQAVQDSAHYKLLAGKTTMLAKGKGVSRKERSRQVHSQRIERITRRTIEKIYDRIADDNPSFRGELSEMFELNKQIALTRGSIMALSHDIGHVGCGHEGERAINSFFSHIKNIDEVRPMLDEHRKYFGEEYESQQGHIVGSGFEDPDTSISFEHNELSAIIFNKIVERAGINLSEEERKKLTLGILAHSTSRVKNLDLISDDIAAQIVRVADKIEYINYDYEEIKSLVRWDSRLEEGLVEYFGKPIGDRMEQTTDDLADEAIRVGEISERHHTMRQLKRARKSYEGFIYLYSSHHTDQTLHELLNITDDAELERYYAAHPGAEALYSRDDIKEIREQYETAKSKKESKMVRNVAFKKVNEQRLHLKSMLQGENSERIHWIYDKVLGYYYNHPEEIPETFEGRVSPIEITASRPISYSLSQDYDSTLQRTLEFVSLFDDEAIVNEYKRLVNERIEKGEDYGVTPITMADIKQYSNEMFDEKIQKSIEQSTLEGTPFTLKEMINKLENESIEYEQHKLTAEGRNVIKRFYAARLYEYNEDRALQILMEEADKKREDEKKAEEPVVDGTKKVKEPVATQQIAGIAKKPLSKPARPTNANVPRIHYKKKRITPLMRRILKGLDVTGQGSKPTSEKNSRDSRKKTPPEGHSGPGE